MELISNECEERFMNIKLFKRTERNVDSFDDSLPNKSIVYFANGKLQKVSPDLSNGYYDARYLFSDRVLYDLEKLKDIKNIRITTFKTSFISVGSPIANLDYFLRMKSGAFYHRDKDFCSACLWKATEMMFANEGGGWGESDFYRLVQWHIELGMFQEAEKAEKYIYKRLKKYGYYSQVVNNIKNNPEYIKQQELFNRKNLDRKEYYSLYYNIPEVAPKSFGAYRRMKNSKTANYLKIKKVATTHGISIKEFDRSNL